MSADATVALRLLIDGEWIEGSGPVLRSVDPAHPETVVAEGATATEAEVDRAVAAAARAARDWARLPLAERGAVLIRAAALLERDADALGRELSREEGKPLAEGRGEVLRAAQVLRYQGAAGDREAGELYASPRAGERILVTRRPLGVVAVVTPFNFPVAIPAWKIAPALVHGNAVVWKAASSVPLLAQRLAEVLASAGLPAGALNLVAGPGALGSRLARHPDVHGFTFTGSTAVGRELAGLLAASGTPFQAELGGKNASVVLDDADLDVAVDQVMAGAFRGSGQRCTATSRLVVTAGVADDLLERLAARTAALAVGDPLDAATDLGPLVDDRAQARVSAVVEAARDAQVRELSRHPGDTPHEGYFVAPAIFELGEGGGVVDELWREELFGPVLAVRRARDVEEAFALAGDAAFGLSAAVFTRDLGRALAAVDDLRVGVLHVNSESGGADPHVPFGGVGASGFGPKEQGAAARDFFTETTTVYLKG